MATNKSKYPGRIQDQKPLSKRSNGNYLPVFFKASPVGVLLFQMMSWWKENQTPKHLLQLELDTNMVTIR